MVSDDAESRKWIRKETFKSGAVISVVKDAEKDEKKVYEMYYEYEEPVNKIVPHRILALNRGEKEDILRVSIKMNADLIMYLSIKKSGFVIQHSSAAPIVLEAIEDSYKRLIQPSIEREIRNELTEKGEEQAIHIFSENLRNLLLAAAVKRKSGHRCRSCLPNRL